METKKHRKCLPVFVVLVAAGIAIASGAWDGGGDGETWCDCENWLGDECPGGDDTVLILAGEDGVTVTYDCTAELIQVKCLNLDGEGAGGGRAKLIHESGAGTLQTTG